MLGCHIHAAHQEGCEWCARTAVPGALSAAIIKKSTTVELLTERVAALEEWMSDLDKRLGPLVKTLDVIREYRDRTGTKGSE